MENDIRLFKLVTGELVMGRYDKKKDIINEVASIQKAPTQQGGVQMLFFPYGIPFENTFCGSIEGKHVLYNYSEVAQELQDKYLEVCEKAKDGGMGKLKFGELPVQPKVKN